MKRVTSHTFTDLSGLRTARTQARDELLVALFGTTDKRVRLGSDCYLLETLTGGQWVRHTTGLSEAEHKVTMYQGHGYTHRLVLRAG